MIYEITLEQLKEVKQKLEELRIVLKTHPSLEHCLGPMVYQMECEVLKVAQETLWKMI